MPSTTTTTTPTTARVDPRGPRFAAAVTSAVLAGVLLAGPHLGLALLVVQAFAFGAGALLGLRYQPYGWFFRHYVRPRLGEPADLEDERPPRFAQAVGFGFALLAIAGALAHVDALFYVAAGFALAAALLNAVFDFCLGCELYLLGARVLGRRGSSR